MNYRVFFIIYFECIEDILLIKDVKRIGYKFLINVKILIFLMYNIL